MTEIHRKLVLGLLVNFTLDMVTPAYPREYLYQRIVQSKLFIDDNYARKITIDEISGEAFFSKFHFIRLFKQTYQKTPHQYLAFVRIEKAMQLMRTGITVAEVCSAVGFDTLSAFGNLFKRTVGITPSAYLKQQRLQIIQLKEAPLNFVPGCIVYQYGLGEK
ncbi:AraC family transcriptional regulator [Pedobacter fastidiosus]|uniref:AraC family transcriptional regulator n=1 Tax=Pedobacter fastidiosus TaxID=2765361 RepID=UPI001C9B324F|nr:AraC family transcriptional regulator [Pedobacter fastidiosus]